MTHAFPRRFASLLLLLTVSTMLDAGVASRWPDGLRTPGSGRTIHVPRDRPTVQAAIRAAASGDLVLVSPGVYREAIELDNKEITVASLYLQSGDEKHIRQTVLDGRVPQPDGRTKTAGAVVKVGGDVGPKTRIVGFTIRNGDDGISCHARIDIEHNRFVNNTDAIDYEAGGGNCRHNLFEHNRDDAVDLDGACAVAIEHNVIRNNKDDGIEIRLHKYSGPTLQIVIRNNIISGNGEDGIQIIDYPDRSDRAIRIERNLIADTAMAAIGCMSDGNTKENYEAADIPEPILVINNTFVGNHYGITGGDALVAVNNIFAGTAKTALKNVDGRSIAASNLFWNNGKDHEGSRVDKSSIVLKDPVLTGNHRLKPGSPCIDAGVADFRWQGRAVLKFSPEDYSGPAPDLGAFEHGTR